MRVEAVNNFDRLKELRPGWNALLAVLGEDASVFGSFAWHYCWWQHFSEDALLHILAVWEGKTLIGLAPLMLRVTTLHGLPVRFAGFIENKNSPHNDIWVLPTHREAVLSEIIRFLSGQCPKWDVLVLRRMPDASPNVGILIRMLNEMRLQWQRSSSLESPSLTVNGNWQAYLAGRSPRTRKTLRNIQNTLTAAGEIMVNNIQTWDEFISIKEEVFAVARKSWTEQIGDSMATPTNREFFEDLSRTAAEQGWLSIWTLRLNGKMIAFEYHLRGCGKEHAMRGSYDPAFAYLSPGTFLEMQIIRNVFNVPDRVKIYDFGGSFDNYKKRWAEDCTRHCTISIFNDRLYSRIAAFHELKTIRTAKYIRNRFRRWNNALQYLRTLGGDHVEIVGKTHPQSPWQFQEKGVQDQQRHLVLQ